MRGRKSKNLATLQVSGTFVLIVIISILFSFYTKKIEPTWIIAIGMFVESFVAVPLFNMKYYELWGENWKEDAIKTFFPFYNYTMTMSKYIAIPILIMYFIIVISFILCLFPFIFKIFGNTFLYMFVYRFPIYIIVMCGIVNILIGIGLYDTIVQIENKYSRTFPKSSTKKGLKIVETIYRVVPFCSILLCVLPLFRLISLFSTIEKETSLLELGETFLNSEGELE